MRRIEKASRRAGFTLIEMLAATIVISMLLVALVSISRSSARQAQRANKLRVRFPSTSILEDQVSRDLRNADGYRSLDGGVTLFGAIASNPLTGQGTHQIARVTYAVQNVRGLNVLTRTEQPTGGTTHRRIVWIGAGGLSVMSVGTVSDHEIDPQVTGGLSAMPAVFDVRLSGQDGEAILNQRVHHHMEVR